MRVITLIYWEEPLVSAMQQCILPTAVNNHAGKYLLGKGKAMVAAGQAKRCQSISGRVRQLK